MLSSKLLPLGVVAVSVFSLAACASDPAEEVAGSSADALTADSLSITCRTLGDISQCGATSLCKSASEGQCKAKASALANDPKWDEACRRAGVNQMACGWQSSFCTWEQVTTCVPRSGKTTAGASNLAVACNTLGELGACGRVASCKAGREGACRATDDAIAMDPQWEQMCPRAGTNPEACQAQSFCVWEDINTCTPRSPGATQLDLGTACMTLGEAGACGTVPVCKGFGEGQCVAKESAIASDPSWVEACRRAGVNEQACGWQSSFCKWEAVDQCTPLSGPRPNSRVDLAAACDSFGQVGMCSRAPICKPVLEGACRATPNALAGDPSWATQCPQAGFSQDTCGWMAPFCKWEPTTRCVPR